VARELRGRGHQVFFVGTERGLEAKLVPAEGFELRKIDIGGLNRVSMKQKLATLARLPFTTLVCLPMVRKSAAVFSMGGYVCRSAGSGRSPGDVCRSGVMEPNAVPGFTNRAIGRMASRALVSFPETHATSLARRTTGMPVRDEFFRIAPSPAPRAATPDYGRQPGLPDPEQRGATELVLFRLPDFPCVSSIRRGRRGFDEISQEFARTGLDGEVVRFITDMPAAFSAADLGRLRAGAGTVSELAAAGRPSILAPFPFAADDHQTRNAKQCKQRGCTHGARCRDEWCEAVFRSHRSSW